MEFKYILAILFSCVSVCPSTSGMANNCSAANLTLVSCGPHNSSMDQCLGLGCCWNSSSSANNATQCYGIPNNHSTSTTSARTTSARTTSVPTTTTTVGSPENCQVYRGQVCDPWLNVTLMEYRWTPRFIDNRFGLNKTESLLREYMYAIDQADGQERCKPIIKIMLCGYVLPPCNDNNMPHNYCREDCDGVFKMCSLAMREILGTTKYIHQRLGLKFAHAELPNCTKMRYSFEYKAANSTCILAGIFNTEPSTEKETGPPAKSKTAVLAGAISSVVTLLVIFIIIACISKRRKRKPLKLKDGVTFAAMTMRDRIRDEAIHALDESKILSLFNPDEMKQLPLANIQYVRDLGSGNFGLVFLGKAYGLIEGKDDEELLVAVKTLKEGSTTEAKEDFFKEVALMSVLHHENIVELLAVSTDEEPYGMIFEFMDLGDLNQYLRKAGPYFDGDEEEKVTLTPDDLMAISLQCAAGMEHLQMLRFVHRDVATRNCLVGTGLIVKISDFGMSRDIYASDYYKVEGKALLPIRWMPPEALLMGKFTVESDVYSFGVLLWEIYTLALQPYYGYSNTDVVEFIKKGIILGQPEDCPDYVYQIMKNCWNKDTSQRPSFTLLIAQLKQEETSHEDSLDHPPSKNNDELLYQNIAVLPEDLKDEVPFANQDTSKISQKALGALQNGHGVHPGSGYLNVAL